MFSARQYACHHWAASPGSAAAESVNARTSLPFDLGYAAHQAKLTFVYKLSDMDMPINAKAEGRILVPWEHVKYPNLTIQDSSGRKTCYLSVNRRMMFVCSWY